MKVKYGSRICDVKAADDFQVISHVRCRYGRETLRYAALRYFQTDERLRSRVTSICWKLRLMSGKGGRPYKAAYLVPSSGMDLPGQWVILSAQIDREGVTVHSMEICEYKPVVRKKEEGWKYRNSRGQESPGSQDPLFIEYPSLLPGLRASARWW